jgi:hypothetical protein
MQLQFVYGNPRKKKKTKVKRKNKRSLTVARKRRKKVKAKRKVAVLRKKVVKSKKRASHKLKATKALKRKVVRRGKRGKKRNPELVYAKAFDVVGKTKKGKNKLKQIKKELAGKIATSGEIAYGAGRTKLEREKLRLPGLSKRKKKAIRRKVAKFKKRLDKMKAHRAFILGKARTMAEGFKIEGKVGRVSKKVKSLKKNPGGKMEKLEKALGMSAVEVGGLAAGGLLYGAVNGAVARFARPIHTQLVKVPVVGTALPALLLGAIANYLGERQGIEALKVVGKGLVGASVVGIGVNASQMVPALRPQPAPVSGLGYEEMYGLPEGLGGQMGADEADFGGIDYTMEGVDYTMEGMGADEADFGGIDYTMEGMGADEADFGDIPEGMGAGQMG